MGVILNVVENGVESILEVPSAAVTEVVVTNSTSAVVEVATSTDPVVLEVMAGIPGSPNLYVSDTPPAEPFEGQVWIDLS